MKLNTKCHEYNKTLQVIDAFSPFPIIFSAFTITVNRSVVLVTMVTLVVLVESDSYDDDTL